MTTATIVIYTLQILFCLAIAVGLVQWIRIENAPIEESVAVVRTDMVQVSMSLAEYHKLGEQGEIKNIAAWTVVTQKELDAYNKLTK